MEDLSENKKTIFCELTYMWTVKNLKKQKIDACQWRDGGRQENGGKVVKGVHTSSYDCC